MTIDRIINEISISKYIILCVRSSIFNNNLNMNGGHFIIIEKIVDDMVRVINPIKAKYEIKLMSIDFILKCCTDYGSWRILIKEEIND